MAKERSVVKRQKMQFNGFLAPYPLIFNALYIKVCKKKFHRAIWWLTGKNSRAFIKKLVLYGYGQPLGLNIMAVVRLFNWPKNHFNIQIFQHKYSFGKNPTERFQKLDGNKSAIIYLSSPATIITISPFGGFSVK